jgi:hypothetical protein
MLAILLLGEIPDATTILGIAAVTTGVMLAAGALGEWRPSQEKAPYAPHEPHGVRKQLNGSLCRSTFLA